MKVKILFVVFTILCSISTFIYAQDSSSDFKRVEKEAYGKYIQNPSRQEFRFTEDTVIQEDETIDGNVIVSRANLTIKGKVHGDVLVLFGSVKIKDAAQVDGNITTVNGRIHQASNSFISGNQVETSPKNFDVSESEVHSWQYGWPEYEGHSTLPLRKIHDNGLVRYNRVQGLFLGAKVPKYIGGKHNYFTLHGFAGYGFMEKQWRYELGLDRWLFNQKDFRFEIGGKFYDLTDTRDNWLLSSTENSLSAFFLKEDYHDFYRRSGFELHASQNLTVFLKGTVTYRNDRYESLAKHAEWALFSQGKTFRENPFIDDGRMRSVYGELYLDTRDNPINPSDGWYARAGLEVSSRNGLNSDFSFNQYQVEIRRYQKFGYNERLDMRLMVGSAEGILPLQKEFQLGGMSTLRGYNYKSFRGNRLLLLNLEYNLNPKIFSSDFLFFDNINYVVLFDAGKAWQADPQRDDKWYEGFSRLKFDDIKADIGLALSFKHGKYRLSFAKRLDSGAKPIIFSFRMVKPF